MNPHSEQFLLIPEYFQYFSHHQLDTFQQLYEIFLSWNSKVNLISRKDVKNFFLHHVLHSLSILKFLTFPDNSKFIDVGTGGGFPGIPLAIALPESHFILVDSVEKKIKAVSDIAQTLKLQNVTCVVGRAEHLKLSAHYVLGRAVTSLPQFFSLTKHLIQQDTNHRSGIIYLKGGDIDTEISKLNAPVTIYNIFDKISLPYFQTKKIIFINFPIICDVTLSNQ